MATRCVLPQESPVSSRSAPSRNKPSENLVKRTLSKVLFRNMSSEEPKRPADTWDEPLKLTDPKAMRALAHPVRMALLDLIAVAGTLTATQASEALGESPANCAFHLRTLAKYGFAREAGGGRGRERPWTRTRRTISISSTEQDDPQAAIAA